MSSLDYERFDSRGPYEGKRGGTYWITESGEKTYEKPSEDAKAGDERTDEHRRKNQSLLSRVAEVPGKIIQKVTDWVKSKYADLASRYGNTGAKLVLGGMVALLPVPVPGTSLLPIAIAEGIRRTGKLFSHSDDFSELPVEDLMAAIREQIESIYAENGEDPPAIDESELERIATEMLSDDKSELA